MTFPGLNQAIDWRPDSAAATSNTLGGEVLSMRIADRRERPFTNDDLEKFQQRNGVIASRNGERLEIHVKADGSKHVLFDTQASSDGLKEAQDRLDAMVENKSQELEKRYGVKISRENQFIGPMMVMAAQSTGIKDVYARAPRIGELIGLERALHRSEPSGDGVNIYFVKGASPKGFGVFAFYDKDPNGQPSLFFQPAIDGRPPTQNDRPAQSFLSGSLDPDASLEALSVHELSHRHQIKLGWEQDNVSRQSAAKYGWQAFRNRRGEQEFLLRSNETWPSGESKLYRNIGMWFLANKDGEALDENGNVTTSDRVLISNDEMAKRSASPAVTPYFRDPIEMYAEGLMFLRLGQDSRRELIVRNRDLYNAVKEADQAEIDRHFGVGRKIRALDGTLIENSQSSRASIETFEKLW